MPIAAIESLVQALSLKSTSTISETLEYMDMLTKTLIAATPNPISLSAGTDLFRRYLISSLEKPEFVGGDFETIREHLLRNGEVFVERSKAARDTIAKFGTHFVRDGCTVLTYGGSRVVGSLLREAADASHGSIRFKVVYVMPSGANNKEVEGASIVSSLRKRGVPVATIPDCAVAYSMGKIDMLILGAEGVVENGGVISRLGTYQMALLAKAAKKPLYIVAESHKFVRLFPLGQFDLPIEQKVIDFQVESGKEGRLVTEGEAVALHADEGIDMKVEKPSQQTDVAHAVDFTVSLNAI